MSQHLCSVYTICPNLGHLRYAEFHRETAEDENVLITRFHSEEKGMLKVILSIFSGLSFRGSLVGGENLAHGENVHFVRRVLIYAVMTKQGKY